MALQFIYLINDFIEMVFIECKPINFYLALDFNRIVKHIELLEMVKKFSNSNRYEFIDGIIELLKIIYRKIELL